MAHPFVLSPFDGDAYLAYLTTGERFYLVQVAGEVIELLGQDHMADSSDEEEQQDVSGAPKVRVPDLPQLNRVLAGLSGEPFIDVPTDPAVRRLVPDASLDPEVAAEFRKFTDGDIREAKVSRLVAFAGQLMEAEPSSDEDKHVEWAVTRADCADVAMTLTDMRLVLAERLDLVDDEASDALGDFLMEQQDIDDLDPDDERRYVLGMLYMLCGYLQESLVECMLSDDRTVGE
ncbi:DUF2017 family protein [Jonesia denitrificans]|uniref:Uncharacterized protein n=1 Tax=Jonesia denitrificans (strain ATCC 14870 / DSM 20603 / BCRC 15368 / CIP 55.134 / JCM 11481 / NBRC 15587 / NCTC 10816 / Prevot 55134) TaxID=471856 RepID=C7R2H5_JONDD|nr:DUF2017 family protein [Jonesia denitrificans]ACV08546.1 hypothetical protein Jden_0884 [Jonesia denitrificans DSM 20603]ASE07824.1 DUF2017 domain-containing protein [Jonesia denitrificans]QXB42435.1 DUF2017 domain-containing protein [Jonesia denitrificans]SQH20530.1 Domain of uncharacterised function (DUF2017) [Jonesia denitrificans]